MSRIHLRNTTRGHDFWRFLAFILGKSAEMKLNLWVVFLRCIRDILWHHIRDQQGQKLPERGLRRFYRWMLENSSMMGYIPGLWAQGISWTFFDVIFMINNAKNTLGTIIGAFYGEFWKTSHRWANNPGLWALGIRWTFFDIIFLINGATNPMSMVLRASYGESWWNALGWGYNLGLWAIGMFWWFFDIIFVISRAKNPWARFSALLTVNLEKIPVEEVTT